MSDVRVRILLKLIPPMHHVHIPIPNQPAKLLIHLQVPVLLISQLLRVLCIRVGTHQWHMLHTGTLQ